jgi:hypothetical protein
VGLPPVIKAEVKLTTGDSVSISAREIAALEADREDGAGIVAAIFVGGDRDADGRWVIVDAAPWLGRVGDSVSATRPVLVALARTQPALDGLRRYVSRLWPPFLDAWKGAAGRGHEELLAELERSHREGTLLAALPKHDLLAVEHRRSVADLVAQHGESDAGRLTQDMLAYLIASAGYTRVTNNAVGVPDFVLAGLAGTVSRAAVRLDDDDLQRLLRLCEEAGDTDLAARLREAARQAGSR